MNTPLHLIGLNLRGFFYGPSWLFFLDFYQNHMAFWPLTSSFYVERDFNSSILREIMGNFFHLKWNGRIQILKE